jgi:hypothetical protein
MFEEKWEYNILLDCPFKFKIMSTRFPPEFPMILVNSWNIIVRYEILFLPTLGTSSYTWNISRNCWIHKIFSFYQIRDCIIREIIHPYILGISRDSSKLKNISVIMYKIIHIIFYPRNIPGCSWLLNYIFPVIYSTFPPRLALFCRRQCRNVTLSSFISHIFLHILNINRDIYCPFFLYRTILVGTTPCLKMRKQNVEKGGGCLLDLSTFCSMCLRRDIFPNHGNFVHKSCPFFTRTRQDYLNLFLNFNRVKYMARWWWKTVSYL